MDGIAVLTQARMTDSQSTITTMDAGRYGSEWRNISCLDQHSYGDDRGRIDGYFFTCQFKRGIGANGERHERPFLPLTNPWSARVASTKILYPSRLTAGVWTQSFFTIHQLQLSPELLLPRGFRSQAQRTTLR